MPFFLGTACSSDTGRDTFTSMEHTEGLSCSLQCDLLLWYTHRHAYTLLHHHHVLISMKAESSCSGLWFGHLILRKKKRSERDVRNGCTGGIIKCFRCMVVRVWRWQREGALQYLYNVTQIAWLGTVGPVVDCYHSLLRMKPNAVFPQLFINSPCWMCVEYLAMAQWSGVCVSTCTCTPAYSCACTIVYAGVCVYMHAYMSTQFSHWHQHSVVTT